ncbi:MAG: flagellar basal body-associated FliL family protein [Verrucomicrobiota bacterium]|jgi:flagellar basal body-associated protein FliL
MVAPRSEPTPARGNEEKQARDPQPAVADATANAKHGGAWKAWLPLGVTIVVMPLVAYGVTTFILVPQMRKSLVAAGVAPVKASQPAHAGAEAASSESPTSGSQRQSVMINKVLVNVAGTLASRYLLTSITLAGDAPDFATLVSKHEPQLRDMASGLMMMKTIENLEKPGARNLLRGELIAGFNTILGNATVQELYFTEFAIQ